MASRAAGPFVDSASTASQRRNTSSGVAAGLLVSIAARLSTVGDMQMRIKPHGRCGKRLAACSGGRQSLPPPLLHPHHRHPGHQPLQRQPTRLPSIDDRLDDGRRQERPRRSGGNPYAKAPFTVRSSRTVRRRYPAAGVSRRYGRAKGVGDPRAYELGHRGAGLSALLSVSDATRPAARSRRESIRRE